MHEWGLACDLVRRLSDEGRSRGAARITRVRVRIGGLSGVSAEAFRFGFEVASKGSLVVPGALEVREVEEATDLVAESFVMETADV